MKRMQQIAFLSVLSLLIANFIIPVTASSDENPGGYVVSPGSRFFRVHFTDPAIARQIVISLNAIESEYEKGYIIVQTTNEREYTALAETGCTLEEISDPLEEQFSQRRMSAPDQIEAIPGYPCYRTVEETYAAAAALATNHPALATWTVLGSSWEKANGFGGYDLMALKLTNSAIAGPKPKAFFTGSIHAREYTTAELLMRIAEYLIANYGTTADATWMLDYHEIHFIFYANPDGRKKAEAGLSWRKNTNQNYCGATSNYRGADLNRNFAFKWNCCGGSSGDPCDETYRGTFAASEPETQIIQNYMASLFPDQRGPGDNDPAPLTTSGVYIDVHSHGRLVLWSWGWTSTPSPNGVQLQTFGRKMAYFNNHTPQIAYGLYPTDGTTDDHLYGESGVASFCFELGTAFFESCSYFENTLVPANMPAFLYAIKVARTPYITPAGPDAVSVALNFGSAPSGVPKGCVVTLSATINDGRYNNSNGAEPAQNIAAAEYYIDTPPWMPDSNPVAMSPTDGSFNSTAEPVYAGIATAGLSTGKHCVFVRGRDAPGNRGAVSAVFLYINDDPLQTPAANFTATTTTISSGQSVSFTDQSTNYPDTWNWTFDGGTPSASTAQNPVVAYYTPGMYTVTLTAGNTAGSNTATKVGYITVRAPIVNLVLNKPAMASSVYGSGYEASKAVDGNAGTRWATKSVTSAWLEIDFGTNTTFDSTVINEGTWNRIRGYQIQYWNGSNWVTAFTGGDPANIQSNKFTAVTGNKVRLTITSATTEPTLWEFEVYHSGSTPPPQYTITASAGPNGSISPSGSVLVNSGANQTFTMTPNAGYAVNDVTVDGASQGGITSYTFTNVTADHTIAATFSASGQTPFNGPHTIAVGATLECEDFDNGGEGVAYHDNDAANNGGQYRAGEGVDIETCSAGGYNVGWTNSGEWLEYTCNVASGTYNIALYMATPNTSTRTVRLYQDGALKATFNVTNTGGWQAWSSVTVNGVSLSGGSASVLRLESANGGVNLNKLTFASPVTPDTLTIQCESYSAQSGCIVTTINGGYTGSGYFDMGGQGSYGEWNNVSCATAGTKTLRFRYANGSGGNRPASVTVNGTSAGTLNFPPSGSWTTWVTTTITAPMNAGNNTVRVTVTTSSGGPNLDKLDRY